MTKAKSRGTHVARLAALLGVLVLGAWACGNGDLAVGPDDAAEGAEVQDQPEPMSVNMLTPRAEFSDELAAQLAFTFEGRDTIDLDLPDASHIAVAEITIQPGAVFPWHTHPGPVLITVTEGDFVYILAEDCVERAYVAGEALVDAGGENVHTARNPSATDETVVIATFLGVPGDPDVPLTTPVEDAVQQELDERCEM